jgi:hypothetical protein
MKTKRNLSGIYFRAQDENGKWINVCFEDLSREDQEKYTKDKPILWLCSLAFQLADTINEIGEKFDIEKQ